MVPVWRFIETLLSQEGDRYVFGAEASPSDTDPKAFDCSELVEWAAARCGVTPKVPDGSWYQARHCRDRGRLIPIDEAIRTPGALLFRFSGDPFTGGRPSSAHVAVSLGNGQTIEARSASHGVGRFSASGRSWTLAGLLPGIDYSKTRREEERAPMTLTDAERKAIVRLEAVGVFTQHSTDEPGELDQPITIRRAAVFFERILWAAGVDPDEAIRRRIRAIFGSFDEPLPVLREDRLVREVLDGRTYDDIAEKLAKALERS